MASFWIAVIAAASQHFPRPADVGIPLGPYGLLGEGFGYSYALGNGEGYVYSYTGFPTSHLL